MGHQKKTKCGCGKKNKNKSSKTIYTTTVPSVSTMSNSSTTGHEKYCTKSKSKYAYNHNHNHNHNSNCNCEQKYYFPLPNLPSQPVMSVGSMSVKTGDWFAPGSVQACCSICSTVQPVYANPCNTCRYDKGVYPINNTSYLTTNQYLH